MKVKNFLKQIVLSILAFIADVTTKNANVFYELGIAHTLGKDVILLHQKNSGKIPFDIITRRYLEYGMLPNEFSKFKKDLQTILKSFFTEN